MRQRLLIADDELELSEILSEELKDAGFDTQIVADGEEAIRAASFNNYALAVCDIWLPKKDGFKILEAFQKLDRVKRPAVLFITADHSIPIADAFIKGASAIFFKPFEYDRLLTCIKQTIAERNYPTERKHDRIVTVLTGNVVQSTLKLKFDCTNISFGGMKIRMKRPKERTSTTVAFELFSEQKDYPMNFELMSNNPLHQNLPLASGTATIRWVRKLEVNGEDWEEVGLEFLEVTDSSRNNLARYINGVKTGSVDFNDL